jgi:hypothetical protein
LLRRHVFTLRIQLLAQRFTARQRVGHVLKRALDGFFIGGDQPLFSASA